MLYNYYSPTLFFVSTMGYWDFYLFFIPYMMFAAKPPSDYVTPPRTPWGTGGEPRWGDGEFPSSDSSEVTLSNVSASWRSDGLCCKCTIQGSYGLEQIHGLDMISSDKLATWKFFLRRWIVDSVDSWHNIRNVLGSWDVSFQHPSMGDWTGSSTAFSLRISEAFGLWHQSSVTKSAMVSHWLRVLLQIPTQKLTGQWKIHNEWRCISYWRWGFSNVMVVLWGVLRRFQEGN